MTIVKEIKRWYWENVLTTNIPDLIRQYPAQYKSWCSGKMKYVRSGRRPMLEAYKSFRTFMVIYKTQT
jgi:hypothetical protein